MDLDFTTMPMADVFRYREDLKSQLEALKKRQADMHEKLALRLWFCYFKRGRVQS